jgi:hypothetical protein
MKAQNAAAASLVTIAAPTVQKVRWSAIAFTLLLVAAFTAASGWSSLTRYEIMGTGYLPRSVVPLFLLIVLINAGIRVFFSLVRFIPLRVAFRLCNPQFHRCCFRARVCQPLLLELARLGLLQFAAESVVQCFHPTFTAIPCAFLELSRPSDSLGL